MRDRESTNIEAAAYLARMEEDFGPERPDPSEYVDLADRVAERERAERNADAGEMLDMCEGER